MKKLFLMLLTIASTNVIVAMQPHQESAHERFLRLTVRPGQETQTPVQHNITLPRVAAPRVQFLRQPRANDELGGIHRNVTAARPIRVAQFTWHNQQPAANRVQSNDPSSLGSYSESLSSDSSLLSLSSHASERTENRENNALSDYVFRAVNDFRPVPNAEGNDTAQIARFLVQIRGIPARLIDAQNQTTR